MNHTPGPWRIEPDDSARRPHNILGEGLTIAQTYWNEHADEDRCEANARLIAAAPELYEELLAAWRSITELLEYGSGPLPGGMGVELEQRARSMRAVLAEVEP